MKQTAVEFLVEEISFLKDMNFDFGDGLPKDIIDKAKEMEKEQMQLFYTRGVDDLYNDFYHSESFEKHYNETYKSE